MPEGDTISYAANRIRPVLEGRVPESLETPQPRHARDRWPERLAGRAVVGVDTHGKHLFIRFGPLAIQARQDRADRMSSGCFDGGMVLHSHLGMTGSWRVYQRGGRTSTRAWIVLRAGESEVAELGGPTLELLTEGRARLVRLGLGPDVLAEAFDRDRFLRRLRADDPTRPLGDALLDQSTVAARGSARSPSGLANTGPAPRHPAGNIWKAEGPRMLFSALDGPRTIQPRVYRRAGRPCPRCATAVLARGQGDANRTTYWCPGCQR